MVKATVVNGCIFKNYTKPIHVQLPELLPGGNGVSTVRQFQLSCTPGMTAEISIDDGEHADKSGDRNLALNDKNGVLIPYQIYYVDSGKNILWNNPIPFTSNASPEVINMMIKVPQPKTSLHPGNYSDTDTIIVSY
ncbi:spore coat protein U domain-containing protein [Izhakiella capsodis]|nr:spore coat protein U domain-containing protein [Izhakiella capsodis]